MPGADKVCDGRTLGEARKRTADSICTVVINNDVLLPDCRDKSAKLGGRQNSVSNINDTRDVDLIVESP